MGGVSDAGIILATSALSALGTGGIIASWLRYRTARDRLDLVDGPAANAATAQAANDLLMRQLEAQELRHREDRREYREEVNALRDTVSRMGARMDSMREQIDQRDALIETMRAQHEQELREAHDAFEELRIDHERVCAELAELKALYQASPKRSTDRAPVVVQAGDPATAVAAVEAARGDGR